MQNIGGKGTELCLGWVSWMIPENYHLLYNFSLQQCHQALKRRRDESHWSPENASCPIWLHLLQLLGGINNELTKNAFTNTLNSPSLFFVLHPLFFGRNNIMLFSKFTEWCDHQYDPILEHFHLPKRLHAHSCIYFYLYGTCVWPFLSPSISLLAPSPPSRVNTAENVYHKPDTILGVLYYLIFYKFNPVSC